MTGIRRRGFLEYGAAGLAIGAGGAAGANDRLRLGVIGFGGMGRVNVRDFLRIPDVGCVAVADVDERHLAAAGKFVEESAGNSPVLVKDYRRLLDRDDIDAVVVSTPDHWHALMAVHSCEAGKDVYLEKPLATTIGEGKRIVEAAAVHRRIVQVGTQQRSAEHFRSAIEFLHTGSLGRIRMVRSWAYIDQKGALGRPPDADPPAGVDYDLWLGPAPARPFNPARFHKTFRWFWDYAGGLSTDWGAHGVDIAMWGMAGEPVAATSTGGAWGFPGDIMETPDTQQSVIEFPGFSLVWEHMVGCGVGPWNRSHGIEFHGQNGVLVVDRHGWEVHPETDSRNRPRRIERMKPVPRQVEVTDGHLNHVADFVRCVKSRKQPASDAGVAQRSVTPCHLGNIAFRLKRRIEWDASRQTIPGDEQARRLLDRVYRAPWGG